MNTELQRWLALLDDQKVATELREMEGREKELIVILDEGQAELEALRLEMQKARSALSLKQHWGEPAPSTSSEDVADPQPNGKPAPARGREAVRALMRAMPEVREWTIPLVLTELAKRGWADEGDKHSVGVSLSRMARGGELARPRKGVYRLPSTDEATVYMKITPSGDG